MDVGCAIEHGDISVIRTMCNSSGKINVKPMLYRRTKQFYDTQNVPCCVGVQSKIGGQCKGIIVDVGVVGSLFAKHSKNKKSPIGTVEQHRHVSTREQDVLDGRIAAQYTRENSIIDFKKGKRPTELFMCTNVVVGDMCYRSDCVRCHTVKELRDRERKYLADAERRAADEVKAEMENMMKELAEVEAREAALAREMEAREAALAREKQIAEAMALEKQIAEAMALEKQIAEAMALEKQIAEEARETALAKEKQIAEVEDNEYRRGYQQGYADGHADGYAVAMREYGLAPVKHHDHEYLESLLRSLGL
jgi:hypothetical protein